MAKKTTPSPIKNGRVEAARRLMVAAQELEAFFTKVESLDLEWNSHPAIDKMASLILDLLHIPTGRTLDPSDPAPRFNPETGEFCRDESQEILCYALNGDWSLDKALNELLNITARCIEEGYADPLSTNEGGK